MGLDERFCDVVMRMIKPSVDDRFPDPSDLLKTQDNVGTMAGWQAHKTRPLWDDHS